MYKIGNYFLSMSSWRVFWFVGLCPILSVLALQMQLNLGRPLPSFTAMTAFLTAVSVGFFCGWLWYSGNFISELAEKGGQTFKRSTFKMLMLVLVTVIGLQLFAIVIVPGGFALEWIVSSGLIPLIVSAIFICAVATFWIYSTWFVQASRPDTTEKLSTSNVFEVVVLLCIFPVGIWKIQPVINRLFQKTGNG